MVRCCIGFGDLMVGRAHCSSLAGGKRQTIGDKRDQDAYHCVDFLHDCVLRSLDGVS